MAGVNDGGDNRPNQSTASSYQSHQGGNLNSSLYNGNPPSDSLTSAGLNTNQLPFNSHASETHSDYEDDDPNIFWDELEETEDLFNDDYIEDYQTTDDLDEYESVGLNDSFEEDRDMNQIMADRRATKIEFDTSDGVHDQYDDSAGPTKRTRVGMDDTDAMQSCHGISQMDNTGEDVLKTDNTNDGSSEDDDNEMYHVQGTLREWIARGEVRRFIAKKLKQFILNDQNPQIEQIHEMMTYNKCSLEIDYKQLLCTRPIISTCLVEAPQSILEVMEEVASKVVFDLYPNYKKIHQKIFVRVTNLPVIHQIRGLRQMHLNKLIRVGGIVSRKSTVFHQMHQVKYDCNKCGSVLGPFVQDSFSEVRVGSCPKCQSKGPFTVNIQQTVFRNYQKLTLQESPTGRLPRHKEVILLNDLIDCACPGEEIEVTGIYTNYFDSSLNTKNGFPVFATVIEANHVTKKQDRFTADKLTEKDIAEIEKLSKHPKIGERIIKSIAPSIYRHEDIKTAIALAMFGGQEKNVDGTHLRGDIHVLLVGDPGTAKSRFLKYVEKTGERAVYTTGKGISDVGLFLRADRGIYLVDDFDKMNGQDRESIHEAMERQSISISKAGIVTSLQARFPVIATASPIGGRYDSSKDFFQNVELTYPIVSSFDLICVVKDVEDPRRDVMRDVMIANSVVDSHFKSHPIGYNEDVKTMNNSMNPKIIPQDMLIKYMAYAKSKVFPKWRDAENDKLRNFYADLRSGVDVAIARRHLESMIRMSEAHAKMHLRRYVIQKDVDMAIRVFLNSFISMHKLGVRNALEKSFEKYVTDKHINAFVMRLLIQLGETPRVMQKFCR